MSKTNIVIVAGGLGTRFNELSIFPKILLPTSTHNSILNEIQDSFCDYTGTMSLIINEKFYDMVNNYIKVNGIKNINLIKSTKINGSLNSIMDVYDELPKKNVLFIWSDLIFDKETSTFILNTCERTDKDYIVFCYENGQYRYNLADDLVFEANVKNGNIPGIYYINNFEYVYNNLNKLQKKDNLDLLDFIINDFEHTDSKLEKQIIEKLTEYRDLDTYIDILKNHKRELTQTRFFNKLIIDKENKIVTKQAIHPDYYNIIDREVAWYKFVEDNIYKDKSIKRFTPTIYNIDTENHSFTMEYLEDYIPLHEYLRTNSNSDIKDVYKNIFIALNEFGKISKSIYQTDYEEDLDKELYSKVIDRCEKIKHYLVNYNKSELEDILSKIINIFIKLEYSKNRDTAIMANINYTLCHGDLNGSNIMVNPKTKEIKFIDPRGYFGFTKNYGLQSYEYAKLLYALSGYDDFNLNPKIYKHDTINKFDYFDEFFETYLDKRHIILLGVIWVALAGYISQDIIKANMAYEHGLKILKDFLNDYNE